MLVMSAQHHRTLLPQGLFACRELLLRPSTCMLPPFTAVTCAALEQLTPADMPSLAAARSKELCLRKRWSLQTYPSLGKRTHASFPFGGY